MTKARGIAGFFDFRPENGVRAGLHLPPSIL